MTGDVPEKMLNISNFRRAVMQAFVFLIEYGFALAPPNKSSPSYEKVEYVRPDAILLVRYSDGAFSISLMPPEDDDASLPANEWVRRRMARYKATSSFGSYPLKTDDPAEAAGVMAFYARRFVAPIADFLKESPPDFRRMSEVTKVAQKRLSDEEGLTYMRREAELEWTEQRWHWVVQSYELIKNVTDLTDEEQHRLEQARSLMPVRPPIMVRRGDESEHEWLVRCAALSNEKRKAVHEAADRRGEGREQVIAWEDAVDEYREAAGLVYSPAFWQAVAQVQAGDQAGLEKVIVFLEADPWCFRSGYFKERLVRILPRHEFTEEQQRRLRRVILHTVDIGDRREFRGYCKLGRKLGNPELRAELLIRLQSDDPGIARRALWALSYLRDLQLAPDDLKRARSIILREGDDPQAWKLFVRGRPNWVKNPGRKYWGEDWQAELLELANDPEKGEAAIMVLRSIPGARLPDDNDNGDSQP